MMGIETTVVYWWKSDMDLFRYVIHCLIQNLHHW